jgi:hypothetical protein
VDKVRREEDWACSDRGVAAAVATKWCVLGLVLLLLRYRCWEGYWRYWRVRRGELGVKQILRCRNLPIDAGRWERRMIVSKIVSGRQSSGILQCLSEAQDYANPDGLMMWRK